MEFRILGPIEVLEAGRRIELGGPRARALLALLLVRANRVVTVDELIDALWPDEPPPAARNTIQTYVSRLRRSLDTASGRLATHSVGYELRVAPGELDADTFARLAEEGRSLLAAGDPGGGAERLRRALELWRGPALADVAYEPFAEGAIARLDELRLAALEDRLAADIDLGHAARAAAELEALVADEPLRERAWELLVRALAASGRTADALRSYDRFAEILARELGAQPGAALEALRSSLATSGRASAGDAAPQAPQAPQAARASRGAHVPVPPNPLVGRDGELESVRSLLGTHRVVTLAGPGGSGKTRLAVEVARRMDAPAGGPWFVELAGLADPALVPHAIASAVGVVDQPGSSPADTLVTALADRRILLVLDNCEHLVEAVATLVGRLVSAAPRVTVLATSREPLGVPGEWVFVVHPLEVPAPDAADLAALAAVPSVRLFIDRASAAAAGLEIGADQAPVLARIVRRLDGMPLAIELAAARTRLLTLEELDRRLDDRFALLRAGHRTGPPRHRTLQATLDWSHALLPLDEATTFARLSVFAGAFGLDAAERVVAGAPIERAAVLDALGGLVDKSLVARVGSEGGEATYRLLDTMREYAAIRLAAAGEVETVRRRHAEYCVELVERAAPQLRGADGAAWQHHLRAVEDDIRSALRWSITSGLAELALRLAAGMWLYWERWGSMVEGAAWLEEALALDVPAHTGIRARAHLAAGFLAHDHGDHDRALAHAAAVLRERGIDAGERPADVPVRLATLVHTGSGSDTGPEATLAVLAMHLVGAVALHTGDYATALPLLEVAVRGSRALDEPHAVAWSLHHLGMLHRLAGRYAEAVEAHRESLVRFRELGDAVRVGHALWALGLVAAAVGDDAEATARGEEALAVLVASDGRLGAAHVRSMLADVARRTGAVERAEALYAEVIDQFREGGDRRCVASTLKNQASLARSRGDLEQARSLLVASLRARAELGDMAGIAESLAGLAGLDVASGYAERAGALVGAAGQLRARLGAVPTPDERDVLAADVARAAAALGAEAWRAAVERGRQLSPEAAIAAALADGEPSNAEPPGGAP